MKRSEMVTRILNTSRIFENRREPKTDLEAVELFLEFVEEIGMLPPPREGVGTAKIKNRCRWDKEI